MLETVKLGYEQFHATIEAPMQDVSQTAEPVLDIWPYVESVPAADLEGFILSDGIAEDVYQSSSGEFLHVLVATNAHNVFLVIVINLFSIDIIGHHLLNLNKLYGLDSIGEN